MVKTYKRKDKLQLSENFRLDEFKCKCGKCDPILVDEALVACFRRSGKAVVEDSLVVMIHSNN